MWEDADTFFGRETLGIWQVFSCTLVPPTTYEERTNAVQALHRMYIDIPIALLHEYSHCMLGAIHDADLRDLWNRVDQKELQGIVVTAPTMQNKCIHVIFNYEGGNHIQDEILPKLFLNGWSAISKVDASYAVLNCTKDLPQRHDQFLRIPVDDNLEPTEIQRLFEHLEAAVHFIHSARTDPACPGVFVHCLAGRQRSAAVVAAYIMWLHGATPEEALQRVQKLRPAAFFGSVNFQSALDQWHRHCLKEI